MTPPQPPRDDLDQRIDALLRGPQYARAQAEKDALLTDLLRDLCEDVAARCPPYARFLERLAPPPPSWRTPADVPPLPASMFKRFLLSAVPPDKVVRELRSSTTTGAEPSRIVVDKATAFRQARALALVLKEHLGGQRRPLLVLDAPEAVAPGSSLAARGAAIRGIAQAAAEMVFAMRSLSDGDLSPDWEAVASFFARHRGRPVLLFGFTFIVWSRFLLPAEQQGFHFDGPEAIVLHSGGWKKLAASAVSKAEFNCRTAAVLGCDETRILDFYGMVEQPGAIFVDCPAGNKHAPAFADVLIRRPLTLQPVEPGQTGIIEVLSVLPTSYPGQAILTEDEGELRGVDDCPCGRKGRYFRFSRRIDQAETRGCGDTFAYSRPMA